MTLKVTISIDTDQPFKAKVVKMSQSGNAGPFRPDAPAGDVIVEPGQSKDFHIHSASVLHVHELPLNGV